MFFYKYKKTGTLSISMIDEDENEVAYIDYSINEATLHIIGIERTPHANRRYNSNKHFGTCVFNELLRYIIEQEIMITKITGKLSYFDAYNNNWADSIPFYQDFTKYVDHSFDCSLQFHLFNKENYSSEVLLPTDRLERRLFIKEFIKNHIDKKQDASFCYEVTHSLK